MTLRKKNQDQHPCRHLRALSGYWSFELIPAHSPSSEARLIPSRQRDPASGHPALPGVANLERFEVLPLVSLHPAVDFVLAELVYQDDLAHGYDLGRKSNAQLDLAAIGPALDAPE